MLVYATADEAVVYMFYRCFFLFLFSVFFPSAKNMRQPFSGMAERIFMKLLSNDSWENGVCNVWRMANVDDLHNICYDSGAITRGHHARQLHYKIMSA